MKKAVRIPLIVVAVVTSALYLIWIGGAWKIPKTNFAGSYNCVETWKLPIARHSLIEVINKVKKEHPELEPPHVGYPTSEWDKYWYLITFYYKDTHENVYIYLRNCYDSSYTTVAFIALASHLDSLTVIDDKFKPYRKEINHDYGYFENKAEIKKFEERILKPIEDEISK